MTLKPRTIFTLIGSLCLIGLLVLALALTDSPPSGDRRAAIDIARREISSNADVLSLAEIDDVQQVGSVLRLYAVNFHATYRNDHGEIQNGPLTCTVDLEHGTASIKHR